MPNAAISATGSYVPENTVHNEALDQFPKAAQLLISQKTGVISRRHAGPDQCTSDLALPAAKQCLEKGDFAPAKVEAIILSCEARGYLKGRASHRSQAAYRSDRGRHRL